MVSTDYADIMLKMNLMFHSVVIKHIIFRSLNYVIFAQKAQRAVFICADFQQAFSMINNDSVIYCDPPYAPLKQNSNFTSYSGNEFSLSHQQQNLN